MSSQVPEQTWADGEYTQDDVIESADHTGYLYPSEFVAGENGLAPDTTYEDSTDSYEDPVDDFME